MSRAIGHNLRLSLGRRIVSDLVAACAHVPLIPMERHMALGPLMRLRAESPARPSWVALFVKAYGLVAVRRPELRRAYLAWPWPHLYEHPETVAVVIVEREVAGETVLLPTQQRHPETLSLRELDDWVRQSKTQPVDDNVAYRRAIRIAKYPRLVRRFLWWMVMEWWGPTRADIVGTLGVSVTAGLGAVTLALRSPSPVTLHYGVMDDAGTLNVRVTFDHRVLDGADVARMLVDLEATLLGEVADELRKMNQSAA